MANSPAPGARRGVRELVLPGADVNVEVVGFPGVFGATVEWRPGRPQRQKVLAELGADLHTAGVTGWPSLLAAASTNDMEMAALLLRLGAYRTLRPGIDDDASPLEEARRACAKDSAKLLKEAANDEDS